MLSHKIQVGNFMKTCGISSKTMRKENLKRHMLTHRSKEVKEEDVIHGHIHKKELEMKLFDEDKEKFKRKLEHSQKDKIKVGNFMKTCRICSKNEKRKFEKTYVDK